MVVEEGWGMMKRVRRRAADGLSRGLGVGLGVLAVLGLG